MIDFQHNRKTFATAFKIIGGIFIGIAVIALIGWGVCKLMDLDYNINWKLGKLMFCIGLGLSQAGNILEKMEPQQSKSDRNRALIGISLLMCCSVIAFIFLLTGYTTRIFVPLTLGCIGDIIGSCNDKDEEQEEAEDTYTKKEQIQ